MNGQAGTGRVASDWAANPIIGGPAFIFIFFMSFLYFLFSFFFFLRSDLIQVLLSRTPLLLPPLPAWEPLFPEMCALLKIGL